MTISQTNSALGSASSYLRTPSFKRFSSQRNIISPSLKTQGTKSFTDHLLRVKANGESQGELRNRRLLGGRVLYGVEPTGIIEVKAGNDKSGTTRVITSQMEQFRQLLERQTALQLKHQETTAKSNIIHVLQEGKKGIIQGIRGIN